MQRAYHLFTYSLIFFSAMAHAQTASVTSDISKSEVEAHIRFLAADEMQGRDTGTPELKIAASYIAAQMQSFGVKTVEGADGYFQPVPLNKQVPPQQASLDYDDQSLQLAEDMLVIEGDNGALSAETIFLDFGTESDFEGKDISGKIVVTKAGLPGENSPRTFLTAGAGKTERVKAGGGLALVELYKSTQIPWALLVRYLNNERLSLGEEEAEDNSLPYLWVNDAQNTHLEALQDETEIAINIAGKGGGAINSQNVIGMIEGTDPKLKDEYLLITAHYDHVGVEAGKNLPDSIYNGARDNGIGVASLLSAARYLGQHPSKRSVLFLAVTAEEKGLLGSRWYAEHPLIPIQQMVFNLNTDGAGYNDTTKLTIIGLGRTSADQALQEAAGAVGLEAIADPVPEQNLFDRSDNVNFASMGVPAVTFSPGLTAFDQEITKYYHQLADEAASLNFNYIEKLCEAFVLSALSIANADEVPQWEAGDKYESAAQELYGR
jgi:hypothetical protein